MTKAEIQQEIEKVERRINLDLPESAKEALRRKLATLKADLAAIGDQGKAAEKAEKVEAEAEKKTDAAVEKVKSAPRQKKAAVKKAAEKVTKAAKEVTKAAKAPAPKSATPKQKKKKIEARVTKAKKEYKKVLTQLERLVKETKSLEVRKKQLEKYKDSNVDLGKDAERKAKPFGYRMKGKGNYKKPTRADIKAGRAYWEGRPERSDVKRTGYPKLEKGGVAGATPQKKTKEEMMALVGKHVYAKTGVKLKVLDVNPQFGGMYLVERADGEAGGAKPKWFKSHQIDWEHKQFAKGGIFDDGRYNYGRGWARDRQFKSKQEHEKKYKRKTPPKNKKYHRHAD